VQVETFEGVDFGRSGPSQCFDVVDQQYGFPFFGSRFGQILLVDIIRFGDVGDHGSEVEPVVLVEQSAPDQRYGDAFVLFFGGTCSGIFVDAWETGGYCSVGCQAELLRHIIGHAEGSGVV